jgi:hypothetical protein
MDARRAREDGRPLPSRLANRLQKGAMARSEGDRPPRSFSYTCNLRVTSVGLSEPRDNNFVKTVDHRVMCRTPDTVAHLVTQHSRGATDRTEAGFDQDEWRASLDLRSEASQMDRPATKELSARIGDLTLKPGFDTKRLHPLGGDAATDATCRRVTIRL